MKRKILDIETIGKQEEHLTLKEEKALSEYFQKKKIKRTRKSKRKELMK